MTFTELEVEAAQCVWESMLEDRDEIAPLDEAWGDCGTSEMRYAARGLGVVACAVWELLDADTREAFVPYDWEFIPSFLTHVDWRNDRGGATLRPKDVAAAMTASANEPQPEKTT